MSFTRKADLTVAEPGNHRGMLLPQFHQMRTALQVNASPVDPADLGAFESRLRHMLMDSGVFEDVEVEKTDDPDQLVIAMCRFRPFYTERDVAERLEVLWSDKLRFPFWEAHALLTDDGHVELEAASLVGQGGHYVTIHLLAQPARIPAQRGDFPAEVPV